MHMHDIYDYVQQSQDLTAVIVYETPYGYIYAGKIVNMQ